MDARRSCLGVSRVRKSAPKHRLRWLGIALVGLIAALRAASLPLERCVAGEAAPFDLAAGLDRISSVSAGQPNAAAPSAPPAGEPGAVDLSAELAGLLREGSEKPDIVWEGCPAAAEPAPLDLGANLTRLLSPDEARLAAASASESTTAPVPESEVGAGSTRIPAMDREASPRLVVAQAVSAPTSGGSASPDAAAQAQPSSPASPGEQQPIGEAPEKTNTELQFLRQDSILLDPGDYQFDVTLQYLTDETDFALARIRDNVLLIGEAKHRQRLLLMPLELRIGLNRCTQAFVNVPFGWSDSEFAFAGEDEFANTGGIGDVSAGLTRLLITRDEHWPDVLATFAFSAATGHSDFVSAMSTPGSQLGEGFWSITAALTCIRTYDPVVVFWGVGYRHRFENTFAHGVTVDPGKQILYRLGVGFAVNPRVTLSAAFLGSYITEDVVNGVRLAGDIREPMQLRLAATISRNKKSRTHKSMKTVEPFVAFGLTESAVDALFGVGWTN